MQCENRTSLAKVISIGIRLVVKVLKILRLELVPNDIRLELNLQERET